VNSSLSRTIRPTIAVIEILGGAMGAVLFLRYALRVSGAHPEVWAAAPLPVAAFGFCAVAGVLLWLGKAPSRVLTLVALMLQVPVVRTPGFGYYFNCGIGLRILVGAHRVSWFPFWGSELHIMVPDAVTRTTIGVNVVALALAVLLWLARPTNATRDAIVTG
jgi:hypothetical protein